MQQVESATRLDQVPLPPSYVNELPITNPCAASAIDRSASRFRG
jgi:hypothetical protein